MDSERDSASVGGINGGRVVANMNDARDVASQFMSIYA